MSPAPEGFQPIREAITRPVEMPIRPSAPIGELAIVAPGLPLCGGAEIMAEHLAKALAERGWDVTLTDAAEDAEGVETAIWWGRAFEDHPKPKKSIYVLHGPDEQARQDLEAMAHLVDQVVSVSISGAPEGANWIGNGVPTLEMVPSSRQESTFTVGVLARNAREKGRAMALLALELLPEGFRFALFGDAGCKPSDERATAHPWTPPAEALGMIDALLIPSDFEGCPLAAIDAALGQVPIIHCGQGDLDIMFPGKHAAWRAELTPQSIAHTIEMLRASPFEARKRSSNALGMARTSSAMARDYEKLILGMKIPLPEVTAFLITSGECSTEEARERLEAQTVQVSVVEISGVTPMSAAFQAMLDRCPTPFYVQVDADMLLNPWAIDQLYAGITAAGDRCAEYVGYLWGDAEQESLQGVKIYRHDATVLAPYLDELSCEWSPMERLGGMGYFVATQDPRPEEEAGCFGVHFSLQSEEVAFRRGRRLMEKLRAAPDKMAFFHDLPRKLHRQIKRGASREVTAMYLGAVVGLTGEMPENREMDAGEIDPDLRRLNFWLGAAADGPADATLYLTNRCNHKCPWCRRTKEGAAPPLDMSLQMVKKVLAVHPTIQSVCLAGFGEPMLHPEIVEVVRTISDAGRSVAMVTNGSALLGQAFELLQAGLSEVTVSLNGHDAESHQKACGADTWEVVMEGIRGAKRAGLPVRISAVVSRSTLSGVGPFLDLVQELQVPAHLHNLLPHGEPEDPEFLAEVLREFHIPAHPAACLVKTWPVPLGDPETSPRLCESPFVSVGVDAAGHVTPCRRVLPPSPELGGLHRHTWKSRQFADYRAAMLGDAPLPPACKRCWGAWKE